MTMIVRGLSIAVVLFTAACGQQTATKPAPIPPCSNNIRVIPGQVEGAAGHRFLVLVFNNVGTKTCRMVGYPTVDLVDRSGHLVQHVRHTLRGQAGLPQSVTKPTPVTLRGGKSASAVVEASAIPKGAGASCTDHLLMVTPPGQHRAVPAGTAMLPTCNAQVHPVVAGDARTR